MNTKLLNALARVHKNPAPLSWDELRRILKNDGEEVNPMVLAMDDDDVIGGLMDTAFKFTEDEVAKLKQNLDAMLFSSKLAESLIELRGNYALTTYTKVIAILAYAIISKGEQREKEERTGP